MWSLQGKSRSFFKEPIVLICFQAPNTEQAHFKSSSTVRQKLVHCKNCDKPSTVKIIIIIKSGLRSADPYFLRNVILSCLTMLLPSYRSSSMNGKKAWYGWFASPPFYVLRVRPQQERQNKHECHRPTVITHSQCCCWGLTDSSSQNYLMATS